jgi:putative transposase
MPIPRKYLAEFEENGIYHIYNRTNNKEALFLTDENRRFFLQQYAMYMSAVADTFCWCLLPNHFHLLIRIKPADEIIAALQQKEAGLISEEPSKGLPTFKRLATLGGHSENATEGLATLSKTEKRFLKNEISLSELIEFYFKSFFQSYSLAFNKVNHRSGNLFYKPFKRISIHKDSQLTQTIIYIHANAQKHNLIKDFTKWQWSSWHSLLSNAPTLLYRNEVIEWFGGLDELIKVHKSLTDYYYDCDTAIED